jgi:hypothetical protein
VSVECVCGHIGYWHTKMTSELTMVSVPCTFDDCLCREYMPKVWQSELTAIDDVHVTPLNDVMKHHDDDECPCGPTPELVHRRDGSDAWMYTHHSLDGREAHEL